MQVGETHFSPSEHLNGCRLNLVCVRACARARGEGSRKLYCGVIERTTTTLYRPRKELHWYEIWFLKSYVYSHWVPVRRAAERDGSAFGRSRYPEVMVFLRPSRTISSVRPRPRPFTCFPVHYRPILCHYQCCQMYHSVRARCMSARPSAWNNSAPTGRIVMKFYIGIFFEKHVEQIQVSLKSGKNNGYFTWSPHLAHFFFE